MSILIKNGRIITADADYMADIFIEGETVQMIGKHLSIKADKEIDAARKLIFPGGIDPHVHLDMPFMGTFSSDTYETGTRAALHGGTTMVIDFILQTQGKSLQSALDDWNSRASGNAVGDYSFHMAVTDFNEDTKKEIKHFVEEEGITSFKTFMAYKGALMIDDRQMIGLMEEVRQQGGMVTVHATNGDMIDYLTQKHRGEGELSPLYHYLSQPEVTEAEASERFVDMANYTGCPGYIVHLTCEGALNAV
ncbi:MAG: amidohydrolase family protein, partial [Ferruginibacter sp.]